MFYPMQATKAHILSIIAMVNEKFRERVPAWEVSSFIFIQNIVQLYECVNAMVIIVFVFI